MPSQVRYPAHIRQLKANLEGSRRALRRHRKMCLRCAHAHIVGQLHLSCDEGWSWAQDEGRFARALQRAAHHELLMDGDQLALF